MIVDVIAIREVVRVVVRRLLELYAHDFSEIDGHELSSSGEHGYRYLDLYWTDADRHAFLIHADGRLAGLAMVRESSPTSSRSSSW